jgi:iron(III) transport system permease protein
VQTFTTGIYRTWFGMGERVAAVQLAAFLLLFMLLLIVLERWSRKHANYQQPSSSRYRTLTGYRLSGWRAALAFAVSFLPVALGFLIPAAILLRMTLRYGDRAVGPHFWQYAGNSLALAFLTALLAMLLALVLAYGVRIRPNPLTKLGTRVASMGYAVPGSVIAVGVLVPLGFFDNAVDSWMRSTFGISTGLLLSGTLVGLIFAYLVRFLAVSFGTVEASLGKITRSMDDAARSLGHKPLSTLFRVHMPMLRGSLFTAMLLVFVDVIKELPATLIVRPFNFDTLAVRVYRLASDERLVEASGGALAIVLVGILPVILLSLAIARSRQRSH